MNASAPNLFWLGIHLSLVMKLKPVCRNAGHACAVVAYAMSPRIARTNRPATRATARNERSRQTSPALRRVSEAGEVAGTRQILTRESGFGSVEGRPSSEGSREALGI